MLRKRLMISYMESMMDKDIIVTFLMGMIIVCCLGSVGFLLSIV